MLRKILDKIDFSGGLLTCWILPKGYTQYYLDNRLYFSLWNECFKMISLFDYLKPFLIFADITWLISIPLSAWLDTLAFFLEITVVALAMELLYKVYHPVYKYFKKEIY